MRNNPKMHVTNLQILPVLHRDGSATLGVEMKIVMEEGKRGRAALCLQKGEEEILFHNMLLPGNMRMPMAESTGKQIEIQAEMSPRNVGFVQKEETDNSQYMLCISLYDDEDRQIEELCCPIAFY